MSNSFPLFALASAGLTGMALVGAISMFSDPISAAESAGTKPPMRGTYFTTSPTVQVRLDEADERAVLNSVTVALTDTPDGANYVWHRAHGRLSGIIRPVSSFKSEGGQVCRHIVVILATAVRTGRTEAVACRLGSGRWQIDG